MLALLFEPFHYNYMQKAIFVSMGIGLVCASLSTFLILKGWSLIGDALSHAVVPGVAISYLFKLPYTIGAFFAGLFAALAILFVKSLSKLKEDSVIGFVFTAFFALGMFVVSINPTSVDVNAIVMGNILAISDEDLWQILLMLGSSLLLLLLTWKSLLLVFFDEQQARAIGLSPLRYKLLFFILLSISVVCALQTVGAILVIAMVVTPGATAYLLTDRFFKMMMSSIAIGTLSCGIGAYLSYFFDGATGGVIVTLQMFCFILVFLFSPKYGILRKRPIEQGVGYDVD